MIPTAAPDPDPSRPLPPVLGRLLRGSFWLALRTPLQVLFAFWSVPLIIDHIGPDLYGAYGFAWGFGFLQFLLEFGMSSALQRQVSACYTRGDRDAVARTIACGTTFYAAVAVVQAIVLLAIAWWGIPASFAPATRQLVVKLLWLQVATSPCYGLATVVSSVLQAARRYDFLPRFELAIVILRFVVLVAGLNAGIDFFVIVATQIAVQVTLSMGPALWVMARELGYFPHFRGARWADYRTLVHISAYMSLIQLSVVLADRIDTTILGYALARPERAIAVYQTISKPFLQIRQTGWMLAHLVMPAVASLTAVADRVALERIKYDGTRLLVGLLLPGALLAFIYAHPFLALWVPRFAGEAPLMQLFLVATAPLVLSVLVQMAIGMNQIRVIALAALGGSLVNLPISFVLTVRLGVAGVIWGTVLTTFFSNLLIPGIYVFRVVDVRPRTFWVRTLSSPLSGAVSLVAATWLLRAWFSAEPRGGSLFDRALPLIVHLSVGCLAYAAGYLATSPGRGDLAAIWRRVANSAPHATMANPP